MFESSTAHHFFPETRSPSLYIHCSRLRRALADYLIDRVSAGEIRLDDPYGAATLFLEMARAGLVNRALMDDSHRPGPAEIKASVDMVVDVFLRGAVRYAPAGAERAGE